MYAARHHPGLVTDHERAKLGKMILKLFEHWQLDSVTQLALLGLSPTSRAVLSRYRQGKTPLPYAQDMLDRAGWLLVIHYALRSLYQSDSKRCYTWVNLSHQAFENMSPAAYMVRYGLIGIAKVARFLQQQVVS